MTEFVCLFSLLISSVISFIFFTHHMGDVVCDCYA